MESTLGNQVVKTQTGGPTDGKTGAQTGNTTGSDADRHLVERFKGGDQRAFNELVRRHQKQVFYMALRYVKNDADAADVTQKAFVRAYRSIGQFRGDSTFKTWITRIAINQALNYLRDNKRERATDLDDVPGDALTRNPTGAHRVIKSQESAALRDAVEQLPDKQRMVLSLRIYEELPFREIAELVGSSENAAKVNFHHAVKKLRQILNQSGAADALRS